MIVDRLEIVDVEHDQRQPMVIAPNLLHLEAQQLLKATAVAESGELIGDRLAPNLVVKLDVLQRERRL